VLNQQIAALQDLEHVGHLAVDDRKGDGSARLEWNVLEIGAVYAVELHEAGQVQGTGQPLHCRRLDLQLPQAFKLEYVAQDGTRKPPVMIHRALFGSVERFMAVLIEHFAGAFPLWLAPVQARVLAVSEKAAAYATQVQARLAAEGLRAEADISADKLGAKIRRAQLEKIPYMVVVGEKDMAAGVVSPRTREGTQQPATPVDDFAKRLAQEAKFPVLGEPSGASPALQ